MERHISKDEIVCLFSYAATEAEVHFGVDHLLACPMCWNLAAEVVASLKATGDLAPGNRGRPPERRIRDSREAIVVLMESEEHRSIGRFLAEAWSAELKELSPRDQARKVNSVAAIHKREVLETIVHEAKKLVAGKDPFTGEHLAMAAHALVDHLPGGEFPERVKNGFRLSAMTVAANGRRLAGDWQGSFAAISTARSYLTKGQVCPEEQAYLLSIHGALASDTGRLEEALVLLSQAAEIYRKVGDFKELATVRIGVADTLQRAARPSEALTTAEDALTLLPPDCVRLRMLAMSIVTESLVELGRLSGAVRNYEATVPLYEEVGGAPTLLKAEFLKALILDAQGHPRESEKLFRVAIDGVTGMEIYRLSFIWRLALFESLFNRRANGKAARLCEESIHLLQQTEGIHSQMSRVWQDLLAALQAQALTEYHLAKMREYMARHWTSPAPSTPFAQPNSGAASRSHA